AGGGVILVDQEGILGVHDESNPFFAAGKTATLYIPGGDLDISHVTTGFVLDEDEVTKGGLVAVLEDDADHLLKQANGDWNQPHTRFVVGEIGGIPDGGVVTLNFPSHLLVK